MSVHKLIPQETKDRDGRLPPPEQYIVYTLALLCRDIGYHAIEIGTFYGESTTNIARAMPHHQIITVDVPNGVKPVLPVPEGELKYIWKTPEFSSDVKERIEAMRVDSAQLQLPSTLELGFAFIDGAHTYEYAWNDFNKIEPILSKGGIVVFHDVGMSEGVGRAVEEIMAKFHTWQWSAYQGTSLCWGVKR